MQRVSPGNLSVNVGIFVVFLVIILPVVPVMAQPDPYRTQEAILADFFTLQNSYPAQLTSEVIGATVDGQDIYLFRLGNPTGVPVFIEAAIHGHEYITSEALYYCVEWVLTEQTDLLDTNYILFIPIINRDAYRLHRTNANGVDLNRNFPTYWQATGAGTIYYSGPAPLSEPETQAIHNAVAASQPRWFIDLHAGYAATRITPPSSHPLYEEVYAAIDATARHTFGVTPFPYDAYQFYEGMARYEGEAQGALTWEIELSSITPSWDYFFGTVIPRLQAVLIETCRAGGSAPEPPPPTAATAIMLSREDSTRGRHGSVSRAIATVTITVDGAPLKGAVVYGHWSGSLEKPVVGTTNGDGAVTFRTDRIRDAGGFTFTIDAVEHDDVTYQLEGVTSASI